MIQKWKKDNYLKNAMNCNQILKINFLDYNKNLINILLN